MVAVYPVLSLLIIFALSLLIVRVGRAADDRALAGRRLLPGRVGVLGRRLYDRGGRAGGSAPRTPADRQCARPSGERRARERDRHARALVHRPRERQPPQPRVHRRRRQPDRPRRPQRWLNRLITPLIERSLSRATDLEIKDYTQVLGLERECRVAEIDVEAGDWLANERLRGLDLSAEGALVLGIGRRGEYVGAPDPETEIHPGDTVVLYGKEDLLRELSERVTGDDQAHRDAVEAHERRLEERARRTGARAEDRPTGAGGKSLSSSND